MLQRPPQSDLTTDAPPLVGVTPDIISDDLLRELAQMTADRQRGILSETEQSILTMILPDLCGELLAYRRAARGLAAEGVSP